jgi:hypothetical protein
MTSLVERLREISVRGYTVRGQPDAATIMSEAADRIKALEAGLRPFARLAEQYDPPESDDAAPLMVHDGDELNRSHLRTARSLLGGSDGE